MNYSLPETKVVMARNYQNPESNEYVVMPAEFRLGTASVLRTPASWVTLTRALAHKDLPAWTPVLFMHSLRAEGGENMLAVIELRSMFTGDGYYSPGPELYVTATTVGRDPNGRPVVRYRNEWAANLSSMQRTTVYAGQVDKADPSKFTISFEAEYSPQKRPLLEGRIEKDGTIKLTKKADSL